MELTALELNDGAHVLPSEPRPKNLCVTYGDSITQGFKASCSTDTWAFKLAQMRNWRLINLGYGGKRAAAADGIVIGELRPTVVTYLIGYNDYVDQADLGRFRDEVRGTLEHILRLSPETRVFVITPLWAVRDDRHPVHLEKYRQAIRTAVTNVHAANIRVIDGELLTGPEPNILPDGTHPGDLGNSQIFMALLPQISDTAA